MMSLNDKLKAYPDWSFNFEFRGSKRKGKK